MCTSMYSIIVLSTHSVWQNVQRVCMLGGGDLFQKVKIQKVTKGEVERKMVLVQPKARDVKEKAD